MKKVDATGPKAGTAVRTFGYDPAGNMTSRTTETGAAQTLTWDQEGHLSSVTEGTDTTTYLYHTGGQRLITQAPGKNTLYLPDGTELEKIGAADPIGTRHYGGIAVRDAAGLKWRVANHQATSVIQINPDDLTTIRRRYLPFGESRTTQPAGWVGTKGYVGGTTDNTGLTHLGAREYDPTLGRFISIDPIFDLTQPQQWHGYTYTENSPITYSDPSGLFAMGGPGGDQYPKQGCYSSTCWETARGARGRPNSEQLRGWAAGEGSQARPNRDIVQNYQANLRAKARQAQAGQSQAYTRGAQTQQARPNADIKAATSRTTTTTTTTKTTTTTTTKTPKTKTTKTPKTTTTKTPGKPGPKPAGTGPHNETIKNTGTKVVDGKIVAGGGVKPEKVIRTPGGKKEGRRPDILVERPDGTSYGINVGKQQRNGAPVKREAEAINDLENAGLPMNFVPYN